MEGEPSLDENGQPLLRLAGEGATVEIGLCRENLLSEQSPPRLVQQLLITRLEEQLRSSSPRASASDVARDWKLLQQSLASEGAASGGEVSDLKERLPSANGYRH
jgi:hypothetical protein